MTDPPGDPTAASAARPAIVVCPLSAVGDTVRRFGARRVVSLIGKPALAPTPRGVTDHLVIHIHDIVSANDTQILAEPSHVERLIEFGRAWDTASPLVVHCWAGISRSTAAAFILACALQPRRRESVIARELRAASATAIPNAHLVALADATLSRGGRMVRAIGQIGPGVPAVEGTPFALSLRLPRLGAADPPAGLRRVVDERSPSR